MKINLMTKEIYTDDGTFIKKLECPYKMKWSEMQKLDNNTKARKCLTCSDSVIDTAFFSDEELLEMVARNPKLCVKIDLNQPNVEIL